MRNYLIKSVLQIIPVLLLISLIVFVLVRVTGDPVSLMLPETASDEDRMVLRKALGLDLPIYVQYFKFMGDVLQGDLGTSYRYNLPALPIILERLPASFELAIAAMIIATLISVPLGILSAVKRNSYLDIFITGASAFGKAIPHFWLGIMLILLFAVRLKVAPVSGRGTFEHLILPALTLGVGIAAEMTRLIRSSMLDILDQDYIRTARSKGLIETLVVCKHAFRNSLIPVVTIMALQSSGLIGGALISETIFAWPGMGLLIVQAVNGRDMAIVQASIFVVAFIVIIGNLIADILYRLLDPRIKYNKKEV